VKSIQSDDVRRRTRPVLDEVEHHGEFYRIERYGTVSAFMVPPGWFERVLAVLARGDAGVGRSVTEAQQLAEQAAGSESPRERPGEAQ
jgi:hypothetical protein